MARTPLHHNEREPLPSEMPVRDRFGSARPLQVDEGNPTGSRSATVQYSRALARYPSVYGRDEKRVQGVLVRRDARLGRRACWRKPRGSGGNGRRNQRCRIPKLGYMRDGGGSLCTLVWKNHNPILG